MARARARRRGRRRARAGTPGAALLAVPWVSVILLGLLVGALVDLYRPDPYVATTTITADSESAARETVVALSRSDVPERVETEIRLEERHRGRVQVEVSRPRGGLEVHVLGRAHDPRLAALAADTAAALAVDGSAGDLVMSRAAAVPTRPERDNVPWWLVVGVPVLGAGLHVERIRSRQEERAAGGLR